jgi:glutamate--cysteine ligase
MSRLVEDRLRRLTVAGDRELLRGGRKGIEKESLRVTPEGAIATTEHPRALGSALTHPYITTDYSEALLELITPAFPAVDETIDFLCDVHQYVYDSLHDELLWTASMPCAVEDDHSVPIARYGSSNIGRMKHVYRVGLDYRYGRRMQAIAGVHFNYSLPESFWPVYQEEEEDAGPLREFVDESYFALIRNFKRFEWLIPYLFGNSPAVCKSFLGGRTTRFKVFDAGTQYLPFATSLRMSDIGYKNKSQAVLHISYDGLREYVASLTRAIETPYPEYEALGLKDDGEYIQLNTNILQIENEYYSFIRPKRTTHSGEKPTLALRKRGVEYVEVRALDVMTYEPSGVCPDQLYFLEAFLIYCLFHESPPISDKEQGAIEYNDLTVALRGREPGLRLQVDGRRRPLAEIAREICSGMQGICELLDNGTQAPRYTPALRHQMAQIEDPENLPSARVLQGMREAGLPFARYAMALSLEHQKHFAARRMDEARRQSFRDTARQSLEKQREIEANDRLGFEAFLANYFAERL